jgi:hypothetical protein
VGNSITVSGLGAPYDGKHKISSVTETRVIFSIKDTAVRKPTRHSGSISSPSSIFNGQHVVTAVTGTTVSYALTGNDKDNTTVSAAVTGDSILNGKFQITARTSTTFQYALVANNIGSFSIPNIKHPKKGLSDKARKALANQIQAVATTPSRFLGDHALTAVTRNTISFKQSTGLVTESDTTDVKHGSVTVKSVFNGTYTITSSDTDEDSFTYAKTARSNVLETPTAGMSFVTAPGIFNGVHTITAVDTALNTIRYAVTHANIDPTPAAGLSSATITPGIIVSTFGPYPGNSDIGIKFSTQEYSGVDVIPTNFIGSELTTLGDALDTYSDTINGFEYRIDCDFDPDTQQFTKTFVLIPINFPDPPGPGEVSPLSRFGADKLVFEYPGNISNLSISESADNSSTRFFATGTTTDSSINVSSAASQTDQFNGINGSRKIRKWPILDETTSINDISDETVLYAYASRYLNESKPPDATLTVTVNGSLEPLVGSYGPGEWCSLIVDDDFVKARLTSDLEPREDVIVRKIDSYKVTVPDGTTFPELVDLTLVPEWGVDTVG